MAITQSYLDYIKSDRWQKKRREAFAYYGQRCTACGHRGYHVHHLSYDHFGNEPLSDLMILCADCHKDITKLYRRNRRRGLRRVSWEYVTYKRKRRRKNG